MTKITDLFKPKAMATFPMQTPNFLNRIAHQNITVIIDVIPQVSYLIFHVLLILFSRETGSKNKIIQKQNSERTSCELIIKL